MSEDTSSALDLRSFLGLDESLSQIYQGGFWHSPVLYPLTSSKKKYAWRQELEEPFMALEQAMTSPSVLTSPDFDKHINVETDASDLVVDTTLAQLEGGGNFSPFQYTSRTMKKTRSKL